MARMFQRIITGDYHLGCGYPGEEDTSHWYENGEFTELGKHIVNQITNGFNDMVSQLKWRLTDSSTKIFFVDEIALMVHGKKFDSMDYPCAVPPFDDVWVEFNLSIFGDQYSHTIGIYGETVDLHEHKQWIEEAYKGFRTDVRWVVFTSVFTLQCFSSIRKSWNEEERLVYTNYRSRGYFKSKYALVPLGAIVYGVKENGDFIQRHHCTDYTKEGWLDCLYSYSVVFLTAMSLCNAKGVSLKPMNLSHSLGRTRKKKGKRIWEYKAYTLDIGIPLERDSDGRPLGGHRLTALHGVRGHFKRYRPEKPHVSGFVGSLWIRPHMRGSEKVGLIEKDYRFVVGSETAERTEDS